MSNQPNKTNGAKPAVHKKKNLLDDRRIRREEAGQDIAL